MMFQLIPLSEEFRLEYLREITGEDIREHSPIYLFNRRGSILEGAYDHSIHCDSCL